MARFLRAAGALSAISIALGACHAARARVQDYQMIRLLSYTTTCDMDTLQREPLASGSPPLLRFHARCRNATFYPDGIDIACTDPDDEQTCRIETRALSFDQLDLLRRKE